MQFKKVMEPSSKKNKIVHHSCLNLINSLLGREPKNQNRECQGQSGQGIYHERQVKELCALHALNNLFQDGSAFTKTMLDNICHSLSPDNLVNPHKSVLGLGNYDINVLMAALHTKGYEAIWFDKRRDPSCIDFSKIVGFILNIPSEMKVGFLPLPLNRRHWIAVRAIDGIYYNLDSKLDCPSPIGIEEDLLTYLREQLRSKDKEVFIVVSQDIERSQLWKKEKDNNRRHTSDVRTNHSSCANVQVPLATLQDCDLRAISSESILSDDKKDA